MGDSNSPTMLRCPTCETHFGSLKPRPTHTCPRCGWRGEHLVAERARTTDELARMVALANSPKEIREKLGKKIDADAKEWEGGEETHSAAFFFRLLRRLVDEEGLIQIEEVVAACAKQGINNPSPNEILELAETEGVLLRIDSGVWRWLD